MSSALERPPRQADERTALIGWLVARPRGGRGATKAELLAAILEPTPAPGTPYTDVEEVFNALTGEDGLGALEITQPANAPGRYYLSIRQTLRMYFTASLRS